MKKLDVASFSDALVSALVEEGVSQAEAEQMEATEAFAVYLKVQHEGGNPLPPGEVWEVVESLQRARWIPE